MAYLALKGHRRRAGKARQKLYGFAPVKMERADQSAQGVRW